MMDKLVENDAILELNGWCCPDRKVNINKLIVRFTGMDGDIHYCHASTKTRPDADAFKQNIQNEKDLDSFKENETPALTIALQN